MHCCGNLLKIADYTSTYLFRKLSDTFNSSRFTNGDRLSHCIASNSFNEMLNLRILNCGRKQGLGFIFIQVIGVIHFKFGPSEFSIEGPFKKKTSEKQVY